MKMPSTLRIAAFDFRVEEASPEWSASNRSWGECSTIEFVIRVQRGIPAVKAVDTLLHEIGHAVWWAYGVEEGDKEERMVSTLATAWTQIYRDNPDLLAFLRSALR